MNKHPIFNTFYELQDSLIDVARAKENRYNEYYHNMTITNRHTKSSYNIDYSNLKYFSDFGNTAVQKVLYNKTIAKHSNLVATFFTITLPSKYHYFITTKREYNPSTNKYEIIKLDFDDWKVNYNYRFNTMEEGINEGYKALSAFWRLFYNKIKTGSREYKSLAKSLRYDLISEFHKTLQIHTHGIIYTDEKLLNYIKKCFNATIKELGFSRTGCDIKQDFTNNDGATQYILKYTTKFLHSNANKKSHFYEIEKKSHADFMIGWKSILGKYSRIHKSSNTKIGISIYKKIYHNMSKQDKELLLERAKKNNTCLLYEIEQETYKETETTDMDTGEIKIKYLNQDLDSPIFHIRVERDKEKISKQQLLENLEHQKIIFTKQNNSLKLEECIKNIQELEENLQIYKYTTNLLIIKDTHHELYNKDWFSSFFEREDEDIEYDCEDKQYERILQFLKYFLKKKDYYL